MCGVLCSVGVLCVVCCVVNELFRVRGCSVSSVCSVDVVCVVGCFVCCLVCCVFV